MIEESKKRQVRSNGELNLSELASRAGVVDYDLLIRFLTIDTEIRNANLIDVTDLSDDEFLELVNDEANADG